MSDSLPAFDLDQSTEKSSISQWEPLPSGKEQFTLEFIQRQGALVLKAQEDQWTLGLTSDSALKRKKLQNQLQGKKLRFFTIDSKELSIFLANRYSSLEPSLKLDRNKDLDLEKLEGDAPLINLVNSLIMDALKQGASDIHLEGFAREVWVRFRIDGILKRVRNLPREHFNGLSSRIKIMANLNIMERRLPQDGRISVQTGGESVDLRVSIIPIAGEGESIVLRLLNRNDRLLQLDDMGFRYDLTSHLRRWSAHPHGLILVTGPTGSGKTTTLNALIKEIQSEDRKIITIEDPIEYVIHGIDQIQVHGDIGLTFSQLLRRVLRQDPNIIMVGEIRDRETAVLALRASLTGHLVLSTLHTNNALSVVPRLINMGVEPYLLAAVLKGAIAQRLVRKLCPHCKRKRPITEQESLVWKRNGLEPPSVLWNGEGCEHCGSTGYKGRMALGEFFEMDRIMEDNIARSADNSLLEIHMKERGMSLLLQEGLIQSAAGLTSLSEIQGAVFF